MDKYNNTIAVETQNLCHVCVPLMASVISTAGLSKFNIILKVFTPNTSSILLLQKETKR
jgi:hypothetical protein